MHLLRAWVTTGWGGDGSGRARARAQLPQCARQASRGMLARGAADRMRWHGAVPALPQRAKGFAAVRCPEKRRRHDAVFAHLPRLCFRGAAARRGTPPVCGGRRKGERLGQAQPPGAGGALSDGPA